MMNFEGRIWDLLGFLSELYEDSQETLRAGAQAELEQAEWNARILDAEADEDTDPCRMAGLYEDYDEVCREVRRLRRNTDRLEEAVRLFDRAIQILTEVEG